MEHTQEKLSKAEGIVCWHFLDASGKTANGENKIVVAGKTMRVDGPVELCNHGYHASIRAIDALQYARGPIVQRCVLWGYIQRDTDKLVASNRTCLWVADGTRTLHEFALWCAENALNLVEAQGLVVRADSWKALQVKRLWLDGKASDQELDAARAAARAAAWAAARAAARDAARAAAWDAAWAAARDAAWDAAWDAARAAARDAARDAAWDAARDAAWAAARDDQNQKLEEMLGKLELKAEASA